MHLSELQSKDIVSIKDGKMIGNIIDVVLDMNGNLEALIVQKSKFISNLFSNRDEFSVKWNQIKKIGEDVILVDITI